MQRHVINSRHLHCFHAVKQKTHNTNISLIQIFQSVQSSKSTVVDVSHSWDTIQSHSVWAYVMGF